MKKTREEINELKQECENLAIKLQELTDAELEDVTGGGFWEVLKNIGKSLEKTIKPVLPSGPAPSTGTLCSYEKEVESDKNAKVIF